MSGVAALRVFVIDDEPAIAELHASIVAGLPGFTVVGRAHTGLAALAFLVANEVDLLLLDMYLPDMTGVRLLQQLRAAGRFSDVMMLTAADDAATLRAARALGVSDYVVKPFTPAELSRRLVAQVRRRAQWESATAHGAALSQSEIDANWVTEASAMNTGLPKGLAAPTLRKIHDFAVGASDSFTAQEVADSLGLSRVSARRYLEHLAEQRVVVVEPRYGSNGRPVLEYRVAPE